VPKELYDEYSQVDFSPILINKFNPQRLKNENDKLARIAAMITNIDENVGRLFAKLKALGILENTIVIYLNDNGPNSVRFVGDMRGMKTAVDDGGIRSPLLFHWPAKVKAGSTSDSLSAHIDLLPTILDACSVDVPAGHKVDGRSFLPLLTGESKNWPKRQVVLQTHRGNEPQQFHHFAIHEHPWKLVHPSGFGKESFAGEPKLELYNLNDDPRQQKDLAGERPKVTARLKAAYQAWFKDVSSTRPDNFAPPRIVIGTKHELRSVLTRQDWRHTQGRPWAGNSNGVWLLEAPEAGDYEVELIFNGDHPAGKATVSARTSNWTLDIPASQNRGHTATIKLPAGKITLAANVVFGDKQQGPHQVILTRK